MFQQTASWNLRNMLAIKNLTPQSDGNEDDGSEFVVVVAEALLHDVILVHRAVLGDVDAEVFQ